MELKEIGELLRTQDNRITDQPMFLVEQEVTDWGYDSDYTDRFKWLNPECDYCEPDDSELKWINERLAAYEGTSPWVKCGYKKRWEFVTACFTEQGCKNYLKINGHNLGKTRIFAAVSHGNAEYRAVRDFLIQQ